MAAVSAVAMAEASVEAAEAVEAASAADIANHQTEKYSPSSRIVGRAVSLPMHFFHRMSPKISTEFCTFPGKLVDKTRNSQPQEVRLGIPENMFYREKERRSSVFPSDNVIIPHSSGESLNKLRPKD
jgi:hypothetical protein